MIIPISLGKHPAVDQNCFASGLVTAAFSISTAGTLCTVLLLWSGWYLWHLLHQPLLVLSFSKVSFSTCENVGLDFGARAFLLTGFCFSKLAVVKSSVIIIAYLWVYQIIHESTARTSVLVATACTSYRLSGWGCQDLHYQYDPRTSDQVLTWSKVVAYGGMLRKSWAIFSVKKRFNACSMEVSGDPGESSSKSARGPAVIMSVSSAYIKTVLPTLWLITKCLEQICSLTSWAFRFLQHIE